jgi:hypothetical protein
VKSKLAVVASLVTLSFGACATAIPHLTQQQLVLAQEKWPGVERASLEHGRSLYVTRCAACHEAPHPDELDGTQLIGEMADRAHLSAEEQALVIQFIEASKLGLPSKGAVAVNPEPARAPTAAAAAN